VLLNSGPKGDGSIPEEDAVTLREVGRRRGRASGAA
jgi:alpha-L-fucosidase